MAVSAPLDHKTWDERLNECLFGSSIQLKWLQQYIQQVFKTSASFGPEFCTERIGILQGYLSIMVRIKFDWRGNETECLPKSLVLKIPSIAHITDDLDDWKTIIALAHPNEVAFYDLMREARSVDFHIPKCYAGEDCGPNGQQGFLLLEDLCDIAATKRNFDGLSVDALKEIMEQLASLHALSLKHDHMQSHCKLKSTFFEMYNKDISIGKSLLLQEIDMLNAEHAEYLGSLLNRLRAMVEKNDLPYSAVEIHKDMGIPLVLVHGDLKMYNMMWKQTENGKGASDELVAFVDFQNTHLGSIGEDFVHIFCASVSPLIRHASFDMLIDHYYLSLTTKLGADPPFTTEQIKIAYWRFMPFAMVILLPTWRTSTSRKSLSRLGPIDAERKKQFVLDRCRCTIEDWYKILDENSAVQ